MKIVDEDLLKRICVDEVSVISGIRTAGRTVDRRNVPRAKHGLLYIWNGEAKFWTADRKSICAKDGELIFIPKGSLYKMSYCAERTTFVVVNFDLLSSVCDKPTLADGICVMCKDTDAHQIANIMAKFEISSAAQNAAAELRRKELMFRLLVLICEQSLTFSDAQSRYPQIFKGALWLKQSYLENIPISEFAKACSISISSFRDLFRRQYGMSPVQYRNHLRIQRAKELLEDGSYTIAEVAYASGFENVGYFCNYYKKTVGETPTQTKQSSGKI